MQWYRQRVVRQRELSRVAMLQRMWQILRVSWVQFVWAMRAATVRLPVRDWRRSELSEATWASEVREASVALSTPGHGEDCCVLLG